MLEEKLHEIYVGLRTGKEVDLTSLAKDEYKEYVDTPKGERLVTKMTLELKGRQQPVFIASLYKGTKLEESHFYYLDQKRELNGLLNNWLNL